MSNDRPRPHHYQFGHYWLRAPFHEMPETVIARLGHDDGIEVIVGSWNDLGEQLDPEVRMPPDGLALHRRHIDHHTCEDYFAIVEFPTPQRMTECHFAALVVRSPDGRIVPESRAEEGRTVESWYFTLERSVKDDLVTPTAIVCSWEPDDTHNNYGGDWPADIEIFVREVERLLPDPPLAS